MPVELGDAVAARGLEEEIWAAFEKAARKVGCPTDQIQAYYKMVLDVCKPVDGSRVWDPTRLVGPKLEAEVLQAQYRAALAEVFRALDPKHLERTFAALVEDTQSSSTA